MRDGGAVPLPLHLKWTLRLNVSVDGAHRPGLEQLTVAEISIVPSQSSTISTVPFLLLVLMGACGDQFFWIIFGLPHPKSASQFSGCTPSTVQVPQIHSISNATGYVAGTSAVWPDRNLRGNTGPHNALKKAMGLPQQGSFGTGTGLGGLGGSGGGGGGGVEPPPEGP